MKCEGEEGEGGARTRIRTMCARTPLTPALPRERRIRRSLPPNCIVSRRHVKFRCSPTKIVFRTHSFPNINFHSSFPGVFFPTFCQNGARRRASTICVRVRESIFYLDENIFKPRSPSLSPLRGRKTTQEGRHKKQPATFTLICMQMARAWDSVYLTGSSSFF